MTSQRFLAAFAAAWSAVTAVGLVVSWLLLVDLMPDPLAIHWGPDGVADGSISAVGWLVAILGAWLLGVVLGAVALKTTPDWGHRATRRAYLVALLGWSGFVAGLHASVLNANLGAQTWSQASTSPMAVALIFVPTTIAGTIGWFAAGSRDRPRAELDVPATSVAVGDRVTWGGRVVAKWALWTSVGCFVLAVITAGLTSAAVGEIPWPVPVALAVTAVAGVGLTSFTILIGAQGVLIRFGVLGWPAWRIPLDRIEGASVQDRHALEVGGWGLRVTPHGTAIMLRTGECLVIKRQGRKNLYVSVDDAASAAGVLNGLLERESSVT